MKIQSVLRGQLHCHSVFNHASAFTLTMTFTSVWAAAWQVHAGRNARHCAHFRPVQQSVVEVDRATHKVVWSLATARIHLDRTVLWASTTPRDSGHSP